MSHPELSEVDRAAILEEAHRVVTGLAAAVGIPAALAAAIGGFGSVAEGDRLLRALAVLGIALVGMIPIAFGARRLTLREHEESLDELDGE